MLKNESKRIGAYTYTVTQLGAVQGRRVLARLVRIAGPAVEAQGKADASEGAFIATLASSLSDADVEYFCELFAERTSVKGGGFDPDAEPQLDKIFDEHFAANYVDMVKWLIFCLQVNFGSFFAEAGRLKAKPAAAESPSS